MHSSMIGPMDLRALPDGLTPPERIDLRRKMVEQETDTRLDLLQIEAKKIGSSDERNCEQMIGMMSIPVGYAGPLEVKFSTKETLTIHLPLATTEGALVASVNRGAKAVTACGGASTTSSLIGTTRSIAWSVKGDEKKIAAFLKKNSKKWIAVGEETSNHLQILSHEVHAKDGHVFLTFAADTDEAMGMNMVTIAAQAIGTWLEQEQKAVKLITIAANIDSDKKPSARTAKQGRGIRSTATVTLTKKVIEEVLKTTPEALLSVATAKLKIGSTIAGALSPNLHAANVIAALYLATGQDAAHVVEGSLTRTAVKKTKSGIEISVDCPALMVGIRGGGTTLPAQKQCLDLLLQKKTALAPKLELAEGIAAAVLSGELSLLAAQASQHLAKAHTALGR